MRRCSLRMQIKMYVYSRRAWRGSVGGGGVGVSALVLQTMRDLCFSIRKPEFDFGAVSKQSILPWRVANRGIVGNTLQPKRLYLSCGWSI